VRRPFSAPRLPRLILVQVGAATLIGVTLSLTAACGISNGLDEYVVHFAPGTADATARAVGAACPQFGKAKLEAPDRNHLATSRAYPVRYDVTNASSADKAALTDCLKKYKIVRGVSDTNDEDT
jgi:hypothetical protein